MILSKLALRDFQFIRNAVFKFDKKGFNLVTGENGQGKSSVFRAISYLLFNSTPKTTEDLCNWDAGSFSASMEFSHDSVDYSIEGAYDRKSDKTTKTLTIGKDTFSMSSQVNDALSSRFDPALCKASMIHFQGNNDIVNAKPAERRDNLKRIYNLDFSGQVESLSSEIKSLSELKAKKEKEIYLLSNKSYDYLSIPELPFDEVAYQDHLFKIDLSLRKIAVVEEKRKEYEKKVLERSTVISRLRSAKERVEKARQGILSCGKSIQEIESFLSSDIDGKIIALEKELDSYKIETLREMAGIEESMKKMVPSRVPSFNEQEYKDLARSLSKEELSIERLKEDISSMENGECPVCHRPYDSSQIEERKSELESRIGAVELLHKSCVEMESKRERIAKDRLEQQRLVQEKEFLSKKLVSLGNTFSSTVKTMEGRIESERKVVDERKNMKTVLEERMVEHESNLSKEMEAETEYSVQMAKLDKELSGGIPSIDQNTVDELEYRQSQTRIYDNAKAIRAENESHNSRIKLVEESDKKKLSILNSEMDGLSLDISTLERGVVVFKKEFPNFVLSQITREIEDGMNLFLDEAYDGRYHAKIMEDSAGLSIVYGGRNKDISLSSGAEQSLFQLSVKMAFTKISGLKVLILDEIDSYMSTEIATCVFDILNSMVDKGELNQIFVITHNNEIKELLIKEYGALNFELADGLCA